MRLMFFDLRLIFFPTFFSSRVEVHRAGHIHLSPSSESVLGKVLGLSQSRIK